MLTDSQRKAAALTLLAENYGSSISPELLKLWVKMLEGYSPSQVEQAIVAVIRKHGHESVQYKGMPPFALIQRELDTLTGAVRGEENVRLQARAEWRKLLSLIESHGTYREPELNRTTAFCVRSFGGWGQVCRWKMEELHWREKDFLQLWEQSHGKEEFLTLGCEGVAALDSPRGEKAPSMVEFQKKRTELLGQCQQPAHLPQKAPIALKPSASYTVKDRKSMEQAYAAQLEKERKARESA